MTNPVRTGLVAVAAVTLGVGLSGCGSNATSDDTASSTSTSVAATATPSPSAAPATPPPPAGPIKTLADYLSENNIEETPVAIGEPGSPTIDQPPPQGWTPMAAPPDGAYSALAYTGDPQMAKNPPTIVTTLVKLTGKADPAKVLETAPGDVRKYPGFQGPEAGQSGKLSGFDATVIGGTYTQDGITRMVAQKTVVIPGQGGLFVFRITADGTEDQAYPLMDATSNIDETTKITA